MLIMGVASPYWLRAIDPAVTGYTTKPALPAHTPTLAGSKTVRAEAQ